MLSRLEIKVRQVEGVKPQALASSWRLEIRVGQEGVQPKA